MKTIATSIALGLAFAAASMSPAAARHHHPHYVFARVGAGVCSGVTCTGAFFHTLPDACGLVLAPVTTRFVVPVKSIVCPTGLGVTMYRMVK